MMTSSSRKCVVANEVDEEYGRERRAEIERQKARQERIRDRIPGRRTTGKAKAGDIDAVLDEIKDEWEFVIDPDFNNVDLALALLDGPSTGKNIDSFRRTKTMLSQALKGSVDKHYRAFADALPHHAALLNHLGLAQTQVQETRTALHEAKEALKNKRADLVQLWSRSQTLEEMMRLLDEIEHLKSVPDILETLISEKRLIQASVLLIRSLKLINKPDMQEISAVADLRNYLTGQESALREILVDELHNHLYLKSFWCETRWAAYTPGQVTFPKVAFEDEPVRVDAPSNVARTIVSSTPQRTTRLSRYLSNLTSRPNDPPHGLNNPGVHKNRIAQEMPTSISSEGSLSSTLNILTLTGANPSQGQTHDNPEANSFTYIETLLESLTILGKLGNALDIIMQRLPSEIYSLVDATLNEVEERAEESKRSSLMLGVGFGPKSERGYIFAPNVSSVMDLTRLSLSAPGPTTIKASALRLAALESSAKHADQEILRDMFWTVYSKLDAVTQGLRVVFEVSNRIGSRRDFKDPLGAKLGALFPIADVWSVMQAEIRTLLHDYLSDEEQNSVAGRNPIASINEVLREGRFTRDKLKTIFRFADSDVKASPKSLRKHEDELIRSLRDTMPGLVQSSSESAVPTALSTLVSDERTSSAGQHHRLLIKPDAFHVSVLFQPSLTFINRMSEVLPHGTDIARSATEVLDDFVSRVYLPQLEEKISLLFLNAVSSPDAFQPDILSARFSYQPILKVIAQITALINSLCAMLRTTPFHQESYSRLVIGVIIQLYQRCSDRFQILVSRDQNGDTPPRVALAAQWSQKPELSPCMYELRTSVDPSIRQQLCRQETHLEMGYLDQASISKGDLISSIRDIAALCNLHRSVDWFTQQLNGMKSSPEGVPSPVSPLQEPTTAFSPFSPPLIPPPIPIPAISHELNLPLSREMDLRFGALLKTYTQLAEIILHTIRMEVRCRTMHYLDAAFRLGNYQVDHEVGEPDPYIVDLNTDLGKIEEYVSSTLLEKDKDFAFCGLEDLMERLLIVNARHIRSISNFGMTKVMQNILALQQSIRTIGDGQQAAHFERARTYYSLYSRGPRGLLDSARASKVFSFDEYKIMLDLQCGVDQSLGDTAAAKAADAKYGMYTIELRSLELENSVETDP